MGLLSYFTSFNKPDGRDPSYAMYYDAEDDRWALGVVGEMNVTIEGSDIELGAVELKDANSDIRVNVLDRTVGTEKPADTDNALIVYDVSGGASSVDSKYRATTSDRGDGKVIYASASTLTLTGTPFTVASEDLVYVKEVDDTANTSTIWVNGAGGVHLEISGSTITKTGGSDFSSNGVYELGYNGQDKAYDSQGFTKTQEQSPISAHYTSVQSFTDSNLGIDGTHDGGDAAALFTDTGETYTAETVAEGYTIYNITDGSDALIDADSLYGLAGDGGAGTPTTDDITHATLANGTDDDWDDGDVASIPEVSRYIFYAESYPHISLDVLLDSQDGNNSCYMKLYCTNNDSADTTDDTYWNDITTEVTGSAQLEADGITAGVRTVYKDMHFIDTYTVALKYMIKFIAENNDGTQDNEFSVKIKKSY